MFKKECLQCKAVFETESGNKIYCSTYCKNKASEKPRKKEPRLCPICKKEFIPKYFSSTFCSRNCQHINQNNKKPRKTDKRYHETKALKSEHIPQDQMEILYGSILGDGYLHLQTDGFHRLSLCHSIHQLEYLKFKMNKMSMIFRQKEPNKFIDTREKIINNQTIGTTIQYHAHSISHGDLTNVYGLCYRNKRQYINRRFLNLMTITSLLIWYLDDGSLNFKGRSASLYTNAYTLNEVRAVRIWLWQKFKISSKILINQRQEPIIRFRVEETKKLFDLFKHSSIFNELPDSMLYKFCYKPYKIN